MLIKLVQLLFRNARDRAVRSVLGAALLCLLAGSLAFGQAANPMPPGAQQVPASLPHLYWHFLMLQNRQDRLAAQRLLLGEDGAIFRDRFQQRLGFTDTQFAPVRSTAQRLENELKAIDAQAKAIVDADHVVNPIVPGAPHTWRAIPPELRALKQQHESVIQSEVANLKTALGPELSARLDTFLQTWVTPKSVALAPHPRPTPDEVRQQMIEAKQKMKEAQP